MDRKLVLLRHAKSSWKDEELDDFERPLAPRGQRAAPVVAADLIKRCGLPDLVLCSPAQRAMETWFNLAPHCPKVKVEMVWALYMADLPTLLQTLQSLDNEIRHLLIIGHNPGLEELAQVLCGDGPERELKRMRDKFPTAAYAEIALPAQTWPAVTPNSGRLLRFVRPKDLI